MHLLFTLLALAASSLTLVAPLPASLVDEIKANEISQAKVKRAHSDATTVEENVREPTTFYNQPVAIKRGTNLNPEQEQRALADWEQDQGYLREQDSFPALYSTGGQLDGDKTIAEYEKGFRYGTNKDKLDEALRNAVLKSELYGDPAAINQYRYFGEGGAPDERRRKRRDTKKMRFDKYKDDAELSPEDILTILTLYENERQHSPYRFQDLDGDENDLEQEEESWLDSPVYPHASNRHFGVGPYYYEDKPQFFAEDKRKRFVKKNDPTRELRYLNGPNKNDFYTLSQLINAQKADPNVPLYHRYVL